MAQTKRTNSRTNVVTGQSTLRAATSWYSPKFIISFITIAVFGVFFLALSRADSGLPGVGTQDVQFDYPANALFVAPSGVDQTTSGTIDKPFKTLTYAVKRATAGSTIVMRAGIYRESPGTIDKALTIQAYQKEEVWLDGSDEVTGWVQDGSAWRKDGWTAAAKLCPERTKQPGDAGYGQPAVWPTDYTCYQKDLINAVNPASYLPDMVFIDGAAQQQVLSKAEVTAGTFFVDRTTQQLILGTNPSGKKVEASTRQFAIMYYSGATAGSKLRKIGIRRFASGVPFNNRPGQIEATNGARGIEFDNVTFTQGAGGGLFLAGVSDANKATGIIVRNSQFVGNGASGLAATRIDSAIIENNILSGNNNEKAEWDGVAGSFAGSKITYSTNTTVRNNLFDNNYGTGFWCDLDCKGFTIVGNMARNNLQHGIFYEVSYDAIIASNVSYNNGEWGFKIGGRNIKTYNNTAYNNASHNYFFYDDDRLTSQNLDIKNNISASGPSTNTESRLIYARTNMGDVAAKITGLDNNLYFRASSTTPKYVLGWNGSTVNLNFATLAAAQQQTGREGKGILIEGKSVTTLFKDANAGDFKLVGSSAALGAAAVIPSDVATALGQTSTTVANIGALSWKNGTSSVLASSTPDPIIIAAPVPVVTNKAPTATVKISVTSPQPEKTAFSVTATAADPDGKVTRIDIMQAVNNGAAVVVYSCANTTSCKYNATNYGAGSFTYSAKATDDATPAASGASGTQSIVLTAPTVTPVPTPPTTPPLTLAAPTYLTLEEGWQLNNAPYTLRFYWAAVPNATGYTVTKAGSTAKAVTGTTYTDTAVAPGAVSSYEVKATNGASQSAGTTIKLKLSCDVLFGMICARSVVK